MADEAMKSAESKSNRRVEDEIHRMKRGYKGKPGRAIKRDLKENGNSKQREEGEQAKGERPQRRAIQVRNLLTGSARV